MHFLEWKVWILIKISLKFVPRGIIDTISALVQIMAWCRPSDKPLSEPTMNSFLTHICVTRPQWVHNKRQWNTKHNVDLIMQREAVENTLHTVLASLFCSTCFEYDRENSPGRIAGATIEIYKHSIVTRVAMTLNSQWKPKQISNSNPELKSRTVPINNGSTAFLYMWAMLPGNTACF